MKNINSNEVITTTILVNDQNASISRKLHKFTHDLSCLKEIIIYFYKIIKK